MLTKGLNIGSFLWLFLEKSVDRMETHLLSGNEKNSEYRG